MKDPEKGSEDEVLVESVEQNADKYIVYAGHGQDSEEPTQPLTPSSPPPQEIHCCDTIFKKVAWGIFSMVLLLAGIIILAKSLNRVDSTEYGVLYNQRRKTLSDEARSGGLHIGPPDYEFIKFPSTYITVDLPEGICVSKDGLRVSFTVTFQYQLPNEWILTVVRKYRDYDKWSDIVEAAGTSAVQHTCSDFNIADFQKQRGVIQSSMEDNLRLKLEGAKEDGSDGVYARAISLQLRNIDLPEEYQEAVAEKQRAAEDIELAKNQRTQETTKAQTELLKANEEARKIMDTATHDAELLVTEAGLKANETIYAYETEAGSILSAKTSLNLSTEGVLAYMANQLYARAPHLKVSAGEPAKLSRKEEL